MHLWIINGPSGVGKSTIAKFLHNDIPMSFLLDVDAQRRNFSHYREYREESGELSHVIGIEIVRSCLKNGRDVILEKLMLKHEIIDAYRSVAQEYGAEIHEHILWAPKEVVMQRAETRGWREEGLLTPEKCELFWERMDAFKNERELATTIDVTDLTPDAIAEHIRAQ